MAWLPNGDLLITEREGGLRVVRRGRLHPQPLRGVPPSYQNTLNGLNEIVLDPEFKFNRTLYLALSEGEYDKHHTAVFRARYDGGDGLTEVERIFRIKDEYRGIGNGVARMIVMADGALLLAVPENNYYKDRAQKLGSHIGKILRIHRDGTVPQDNPFVDTVGALPEIWTYGHRVPTGLYQDPQSGLVWEVEPGPTGGDELNLLKPGGNYGWAKATWGFDYNGSLAGPQQSAAGVEEPLLVWMRSPSGTPAGITRYRGRTFPQWDGDFFVGHLAGKALERLRIEGTDVVLRERMLLDLQERIRDVKVGPDNHIYLLTDHQDGRVLRLNPGRAGRSERSRIARKLEQPRSAAQDVTFELRGGDAAQGRQAFIERCTGCHSAGDAVPGGQVGPDLLSVYARKAGSLPQFNYSAAMAQSGQIWDGISLNLFIADPQGYVPATSMGSPPVTDAKMRRDIVRFLREAGGKQSAF